MGLSRNALMKCAVGCHSEERASSLVFGRLLSGIQANRALRAGWFVSVSLRDNNKGTDHSEDSRALIKKPELFSE